MAIFHSKSHFNSAQSHLLVDEKRRNNQLLVLPLLSVRIASLKNARNESSSGDGALGLSKQLSCWAAGTAVPGAEHAVLQHAASPGAELWAIQGCSRCSE